MVAESFVVVQVGQTTPQRRRPRVRVDAGQRGRARGVEAALLAQEVDQQQRRRLGVHVRGGRAGAQHRLGTIELVAAHMELGPGAPQREIARRELRGATMEFERARGGRGVGVAQLGARDDQGDVVRVALQGVVDHVLGLRGVAVLRQQAGEHEAGLAGR